MIEPIGHGFPQRFGNQGAVASGGEADHLDGIQGALGGGIEFPQFFQLLAKKLEPHGELGTHREQVDDVAPTAPAAFLLNRWHPLVTEPGEGGRQLLQVHRVALAQAQALVLQCIRRRQVGLQGPLGGHDRLALGAAGTTIEQLAQHL